MMGNIVWIASYPKSGNTWFRAFMANLIAASDTPVHINSLTSSAPGFSRQNFDTWSGIDSVNLLPEEVDSLLPAVCRSVSAAAAETSLVKTHDAYRYLPDGRGLFPEDATHCSIYIVRNPLDIVPSFAHFLDQGLDAIIAALNTDGLTFNSERSDVTPMLAQKLLSWSEHVSSWLDAPAGMNVHWIRYEDMLHNPAEAFTKAVRAIGLNHGVEDIRRAIAFSSFDALSAMERETGFREKPPQAELFFRKGKAGGWRESLTSEQICAVIEKHRAAMQRLGYLDMAGNVVDR